MVILINLVLSADRPAFKFLCRGPILVLTSHLPRTRVPIATGGVVELLHNHNMSRNAVWCFESVRIATFFNSF